MNAETPSPDSARSPENAPPENPNPKPPWLLLLGVLLGAVFMALALHFTSQGQREAQNAVTQNIVTTMPTPITEATPSPRPLTTEQEYSYTLYVPNDNGDLVKREDKGQLLLPAAPEQARAAQAEYSVRALMKASPIDFPDGAQLQNAQADGETIKLSFNDKFTQPDFWQGSTRTLVTIYALVNTVTASVPETKNVQLLVNDKPVEVLGPMAAAEPFAPNPDMVVSN